MNDALRSLVRHAPAVTLLAGFVLVAAPRPGMAGEFCSDGDSVCGNASALTEDHLRRRLNRTLAVGPASDRVNLLNTPGTAAVIPFDMTPEGSNANFATSLSQWRSSLSAADEAALKEAAEITGQSLPVPQLPRKTVRKFDIWAEGRREAFEQLDAAKEGSALTTFVGADYRIDNDLLVGGMVQLDEGHQTVLAAPDAAKGTAYMAGPYVAYRMTPHILLDAKAAWGTAEDTAITDAGSAAFGTDRVLSEAKVTGQWGWQGWQLSQSGAITHLDETSYGMTGLDGTSVAVTRLSVGPEVKRRFEAGGDASIEPFAFFKSSVDVSDSTLVDANALNTIGGGIMLASPDNYNIRATADYSESTDSAATGVGTGRVQINVPTSILGF